jgi:hypothetical protein
VVGQLLGPATAIVLGGVATLAVAALWWGFFPDLRSVDTFPAVSDHTILPSTEGFDGVVP